jgi:endonuclease YncB( thermonuclease family)
LPTHTTKFIGSALIVGSLVAALVGCAPDKAAPVAADNGKPVATTTTASATPTPDAQIEFGVVSEVIDGNSLKIHPSDINGERTGAPVVTIRLLGIDAPTLTQCGGKEAKAQLERTVFVAGSEGDGIVGLTYDPAVKQADSDQPILAYVQRGQGAGDLGYAMAVSGFATAWHQPGEAEPEAYGSYKSAAGTAKDLSTANKGTPTELKNLWSLCGTVGRGAADSSNPQSAEILK